MPARPSQRRIRWAMNSGQISWVVQQDTPTQPTESSVAPELVPQADQPFRIDEAVVIGPSNNFTASRAQSGVTSRAKPWHWMIARVRSGGITTPARSQLVLTFRHRQALRVGSPYSPPRARRFAVGHIGRPGSTLRVSCTSELALG